VPAAVNTPAVLESTVDLGAIYDAHYRLLVGTAIDRYNISETEAQTLAHDVFLAFITKANEIMDVRAWLVSAICNASKYYLRVRARTVSLSAEIGERPDPRLSRVQDFLPEQLTAREIMACLIPRCQLVLHLRYVEGYTLPEIAIELRTTPKYAQKLVGKCLRRAHECYQNGVRP
jgi:RNA polymerase sigma factor (sigma-70 family)